MNMETRYKIKAVIKRKLPRINALLFEPLLLRRYQDASSRFAYVTGRVLDQYGLTVQAGPFKGLRYVSEAKNSGFTSKILGCYESEITNVVQQIVTGGYETIVDIGCAEGYYAVGFAVTSPGSTLLAFDTQDECRTLCRKLAELNGVADRVIIKSECNHTELDKLEKSKVALMCDCEGFETELLDPLKVDAMIKWDILVELHDCLRPGITSLIIERFAKSHDIQLIDSTRRNPDDFPQTNFLRSRKDRVIAVSDLRGSWQQWAWMRAR